MSEHKDYAMLIYDIPTQDRALYNRLWQIMRRRCIQLNLSVYLIYRSMEGHLRSLIEEAMTETEQGKLADIRVMNFDPNESDQVEDWAKQSLAQDINKIMSRLRTDIDKVREENEELGVARFKKVEKQLQDLKSLATVYGFGNNVEGLFETARRTTQTQWKARNRRLGEDAPTFTNEAPTPKIETETN